MTAGRAFFTILIISAATCGSAGAWSASAHFDIAGTAVEALPDSMPEFFRAAAPRVGRSAVDPDYYRLRDLAQLRNAETPEHFLDSELLEGAEWPATRYEYLALIARLEKNPYLVGTLPYAVLEGVQRLAASFAQVRLDPADPWAQAKAIHHAGLVAHYAADLCQPLHTTIHHDGRARSNGSSPMTGIHMRMDGLANSVFAQGAPTVGAIESTGDPRAAIRQQFSASHALVDRVYELEKSLGPNEVSPEAMEFGRERVAASIRFTSSLFVTAWELSGDLRPPSWFRQFQSSLAGGSSR